MIEKVKNYFGMDGFLHIVCSALLTGVADIFLPLWAAVVIAAAAGLGKEAYDKLTGKGTPDKKDLVADAAGIFIGIL